MCLEEKFQSNSEIAGSHRNSFRASVEVKSFGGRALNGCGSHLVIPIPIKLRMPLDIFSSQTTGDKVRGRKGNSPDLQLRSLNMVKWKRMWGCTDNQDVGSEAAIH